MSEAVFVIGEVHDLDAAWPELESLLVQLHDHHVPMWPRTLRDGWQLQWREYLQLDADRLLLLARSGGRAIGYMNASIRRNPSLFEETFIQIGDAYVQPESRRLGLGAELLKQLEVSGRAREIKEIRVGVVVANDIGVRFWKKAGFIPLTYTMTKPITGNTL